MSADAQARFDLNSPETLAARLRSISVFADLAQEDLIWLAERMTCRRFDSGEVIMAEGTPADRMVVILEGTLNAKREGNHDGRTYSAIGGQVTGMLPFSRLEYVPLTSRAMTESTIVFLPTSYFPEMLARIPVLAPRLVGVMSDRIRETTRADQQREKLMALGKLSAGLAHEMNNPASGVRNAAMSLRESVEQLRKAHVYLEKKEISAEDRLFIAHLECDWSLARRPQLNPLERSDREEAIGSWLASRGVESSWQLAGGLVDVGVDVNTLTDLSGRFDKESLGAVLTQVTACTTIERLVTEVENGSARMSELVSAMKDYSYMDQAPEQEIDIHEGIENTLLMLRYRINDGISINRYYDRSAPRVSANGSELNQVWTNLFDNALDAVHGQGSLGVRTQTEFNRVLVEVSDNGPGIPADIRDRIFEPFFTTKPVGQGVGLGLDIVYRIVRKHRGDVRVDSEPGRTTFQVRIPSSNTITPAF